MLEPICVNPVTQPDAVSACQNFHEIISIATVGSHVQVTGSYVSDNQHGGWAEINTSSNFHGKKYLRPKHYFPSLSHPPF